MGKRKETEMASAGAPGSLREALLQMMLFPETVTKAPFQYPNSPNTQYSNPQGGIEVFTLNWPQTGKLVFPSGHRCVNLTINDLSNDPLQIFLCVKDEATNIARVENKNPLGKDVPYSCVSPEGTRNFIIPASLAGSNAVPVELRPISAVYDPTALGLFATLQNAGFMMVNLGTAFPTTLVNQQANSMAAHGLILPVGKWQNHHGMYLDACGVGNPGTAPIATPAYTTTTGIITQANAQATSSAFFCIATGDNLAGGSGSAPNGWAAWADQDELSVQVFQFNEDDDTEATWSFQLTVTTAQISAAGSAFNMPLAVIPSNGSDLYYFVVAAQAAAAVTGTPNLRRNLRISFTSCGGVFEHHMAPYINDAIVLGNWLETRVLGVSISAANFTADYGKAGLALYRQCDPGSYWQDQGLSQRLPGGPYGYNASLEGVSKIEAMYGERGWLGICGRERLFWRKNIGTISANASLGSNLGALAGAAGAQPTYNVCYDAENENLAVMVLKSNGTGTLAAGSTVGITPQQGFEVTLATKWEGKNVERSKGVMAQRLPTGFTEAMWDEVAKEAATMLRAGPADSVNLQYYLESKDWREKLQNRQWDGHRKYVSNRRRGL